MSEPNPPRRPLATFLRTPPPASTADGDVPRDTDAAAGPVPAVSEAGLPAPHDEMPSAAVQHDDPAPLDHLQRADDLHANADADVDALEYGEQPAAAMPATPPAAPGSAAAETPSFLARPVARLRTPRWQWGLVTALALLLVLQIILADRARWAADAGSRPWVAALCGVLRCSLPAWHEPTAFTMTSRDIRPLPGHPGVLQVQASIRNDARWAQAWPDLRLALSDADGRVIGVGVFTPSQYLAGADGTATQEHAVVKQGSSGRASSEQAVLEPGQSARIAFRVREPAASTDAFTFDFL